jgi:hypothetical protein
MSNATANRLKRLEASANVGEKRYYIFGPDVCKTTEEWERLVRWTGNFTYELKPLQPSLHIRSYSTRIRLGSLAGCIAEVRQSSEPGHPQLWVCSTASEAHELIRNLDKADAFSHAYIFTDIEDEMRLGPGRHRIDQ